VSEDIAEAVAEEAVWKALKDRVQARYQASREHTQALLDAHAGAATQFAATVDGAKVATISLPAPEPKIHIDSAHPDFIAFVRDHFPDEVTARLVTEVREAFLAKIIKEMQGGQTTSVDIPDETTGEVKAVEVPTAHFAVPENRSHQLRFATGGREAIAKRWQDGKLSAMFTQLDVD
jgi:hypothetical protein